MQGDGTVGQQSGQFWGRDDVKLADARAVGWLDAFPAGAFSWLSGRWVSNAFDGFVENLSQAQGSSWPLCVFVCRLCAGDRNAQTRGCASSAFPTFKPY